MTENIYSDREIPSVPGGPTRAPSTENAYRKRYSRLEQAARIAYGISYTESVDPRLVVIHTKETVHKHTLSMNTWRQYRASIRIALQDRRTPEAEEALRDLETVQYSAGPKPNRKTRTSASKMKGFPDSDFRMLKTYLEEKVRSQYARILINWLTASLCTGLRPVEWWSAELIELNPEEVGLPLTSPAVPALRLRNAKHTNQRAHGEIRTVPLMHVSPEEMRAIISHLAMTKEHNYDYIHDVCRVLLHRVCRVVFHRYKHMPTLYSCRHQFTANLKASGLTDEERGCLLGHSTGETNNTHYGKMRVGNVLENVLIVREELVRVRKSAKVNRMRLRAPLDRTE